MSTWAVSAHPNTYMLCVARQWNKWSLNPTNTQAYMHPMYFSQTNLNMQSTLKTTKVTQALVSGDIHSGSSLTLSVQAWMSFNRKISPTSLFLIRLRPAPTGTQWDYELTSGVDVHAEEVAVTDQCWSTPGI